MSIVVTQRWMSHNVEVWHFCFWGHFIFKIIFRRFSLWNTDTWRRLWPSGPTKKKMCDMRKMRYHWNNVTDNPLLRPTGVPYQIEVLHHFVHMQLYPLLDHVSTTLIQTALLCPLNTWINSWIEWLATIRHTWREFFPSHETPDCHQSLFFVSVVGSKISFFFPVWLNYSFRRTRQKRELEMLRWRPVDQPAALFIIPPYMQGRLCHGDESVCEGPSASCSRAPSDIKAVPKHCTCQPLSTLLHAAAKTKCPPARFFFFFFNPPILTPPIASVLITLVFKGEGSSCCSVEFAKSMMQ